MYASHAQKLEQIMDWARNWLRGHREEVAEMPPDQRIACLMDQIREAHYSDYSQWGNDYDLVERMAGRVLGEFSSEEE